MRFKAEHYDEFIGLVLYCVARHTKSSTVDHFDMVQSGCNGIFKAIKTYDKSKNVPLKFWVYRFIRSEIIKARYKNGKERKEFSGNEEYISLIHADNTYDPILPIYEAEEQERIDNKKDQVMTILNSNDPIFSKDSGLNRKIWLDRIMKGMSIGEVAEKHNLSYTATTHRISKVTNRIKEIVQDKSHVNITKENMTKIMRR